MLLACWLATMAWAEAPAVNDPHANEPGASEPNAGEPDANEPGASEPDGEPPDPPDPLDPEEQSVVVPVDDPLIDYVRRLSAVPPVFDLAQANADYEAGHLRMVGDAPVDGTGARLTTERLLDWAGADAEAAAFDKRRSRQRRFWGPAIGVGCALLYASAVASAGVWDEGVRTPGATAGPFILAGAGVVTVTAAAGGIAHERDWSAVPARYYSQAQLVGFVDAANRRLRDALGLPPELVVDPAAGPGATPDPAAGPDPAAAPDPAGGSDPAGAPGPGRRP